MIPAIMPISVRRVVRIGPRCLIEYTRSLKMKKASMINRTERKSLVKGIKKKNLLSLGE
jgi:hypothetical protein